MSVCGAQRILGRAAEHGPVEFSRNSLQDEFPPVMLLSAVQQRPAHLGPGVNGLGEDLTLRTHTDTHSVCAAERTWPGTRTTSYPIALLIIYLLLFSVTQQFPPLATLCHTGKDKLFNRQKP